MTDSTCAADGCDRPIRFAGLCGAHHQRKLHRGDVQAHIPLRGTDTDPNAFWCSKCHTHKAKAEFYTDKRARRGIHGVCKVCTKARKDEIRPRIREQAARSKAKHADAVRERKRAWYDENRDHALELSRAWRKANPERVRAHIKAQNAARYAADKAAAGEASAQAIQARWDYYGRKCWMCGTDATDTDHVKPLNKGGSNWPSNMRPACQPCNRSKSDTWPYPQEVANGNYAARGQGPHISSVRHSAA